MANPLRQMLKRLTLAILAPIEAGLVSPPNQRMRRTIDKLKAKLPSPIFLVLKAFYARGAAIKRILRQPNTREPGHSARSSLYWLDIYGLRTRDTNRLACPEARLINTILTEKSRFKP